MWSGWHGVPASCKCYQNLPLCISLVLHVPVTTPFLSCCSALPDILFLTPYPGLTKVYFIL